MCSLSRKADGISNACPKLGWRSRERFSPRNLSKDASEIMRRKGTELKEWELGAKFVTRFNSQPVGVTILFSLLMKQKKFHWFYRKVKGTLECTSSFRHNVLAVPTTRHRISCY